MLQLNTNITQYGCADNELNNESNSDATAIGCFRCFTLGFLPDNADTIPMPIPQKYKHIDFTPPEEVALEAMRGLMLRHEFKRGGTSIGIARARDLKNRRTMSPATIKRMVSFFARHEVDKRGKNFFNPARPSNGFIAWLLWGGDKGHDWCKAVFSAMKKAD